MISITDNMISGADDPRAMRVKLATVSFQTLTTTIWVLPVVGFLMETSFSWAVMDSIDSINLSSQLFKLCPPPYLMNIGTIFHLRLNLFWVDDPGCTTAEVRDIYRMEFEVFQSLGWVLFYLASVVIFTTHMCLGWQKVVPAPALDIPKRYHSKAIHIGYVMTAFISLIYASFPIYPHLFPMSNGALSPEGPIL